MAANQSGFLVLECLMSTEDILVHLATPEVCQTSLEASRRRLGITSKICMKGQRTCVPKS